MIHTLCTSEGFLARSKFLFRCYSDPNILCRALGRERAVESHNVDYVKFFKVFVK